MKRTVNRTPGQISVATSDSRTDNFNLVSFEGITNSKNDLTVSPSTFIDANNMYMNSDDILSSRPTIKSTTYLNKNYIKLNDIKNAWVIDDLLIYHQGTKLKFIKNNIPVMNIEDNSIPLEIEVGEEIKVLESIENYILVYPKNIYIDVTSKNAEGVLLFKSGSISDICYTPTTELRSGNKTTNPEKPNKLSPYSKHTIVYDKSVYTDLTDFYGKNVEVLIGNKTYHITGDHGEGYQENDINTIQGILTIADFDYIKYSNKGSAIGYKNAILYYAADGKNFTPLPTVPGDVIKKEQTNVSTGITTETYPKYTGEAFISEEGDACFVVSIDHLYAISLTESDWDSTTNSVKKRWSEWTILNWNTKYSKLTWDTNGKLTESQSDMVSDSSYRLNLINMTKPDEPKPWYYSKNYARVINENTFVIFMYAGDLDVNLSSSGEPSNYIKPTIFVYNRQVDASTVKIYQITNAKDERFYPLSTGANVGFWGIGELNGGDADLFGNNMIISLSYRYASSKTITSQSNATAVTQAYITSFIISIGTDGAYNYHSGMSIPVADNLKDVSVNLNAYQSIIGDLKVNYASYNPGINSGEYSLLFADINYAYTDPVASVGEASNRLVVNKYTIKESYYTTNTANNNTTLTRKGEIGFIGIITSIVMMSRSSLRIAISTGLLVTTNSLDKYEYIKYIVSESMRPIYIDEDTLITQAVDILSIGYKNITIAGDVKLTEDLTEEQIKVINSAIDIRQLGTSVTKVTINNKDLLGIKPGITSVSPNPDFSDFVKDLSSYTSTMDYVDKYIVHSNVAAYSNEIYTTDNIVATMSIIVKDENFVLPSIDVSTKLTDIYFGSGRNLYIGKVIYDNNEKPQLYFSEGLWEEFEETIFQLQILSKNSIGVYCRDSIWVVYSDDKGVYYKSKSKITSSCRQGDSVVLSIDGKGSLYPCHRGIAYIEHQSLLSIEEQKLSFITDDIQDFMIEWIKNKSIDMYNHEFWLYIYSRSSNIMWLMDLRNNHWWKWTTPKPIQKLFVYLNELYVLIDNKICKFTNDAPYYDIIEYTNSGWKKEVINWSLESQRLYLSDINRYKHIYNLVVNSRVEDTEIQTIFMRLGILIYRTAISKTPDTVLEYKVEGRRSYVKKLNIYKCNFIKFKLSSDTTNSIESDNYNQRQMKIEGITIKYGTRERIR